MHFVLLLDDGRIPLRTAGAHSCVRDRVMQDRRCGAETRCSMALDELTAVDQDLGQ